MYNIRIVIYLKHEYLKYKPKELMLKANNIYIYINYAICTLMKEYLKLPFTNKFEYKYLKQNNISYFQERFNFGPFFQFFL